MNCLAARIRSGKEETITFDKDDDDTLDFVTASANLRSTAYRIPTQSRWEVKGMCHLLSVLILSCESIIAEMAGNIITAIATTNAIISGLIVLQAFHLLKKAYNSLLKSSPHDTVGIPMANLPRPNRVKRYKIDNAVLVWLQIYSTSAGQVRMKS